MADHGHDHAQGPFLGQGQPSGTMDIRDKERTFDGFIRMVMWGAGIAIGVLIFLALVNS